MFYRHFFTCVIIDKIWFHQIDNARTCLVLRNTKRVFTKKDASNNCTSLHYIVLSDSLYGYSTLCTILAFYYRNNSPECRTLTV